MPRPRYDKLSPEKRGQIMEAAAKEFVAHGFQEASLNRILEQSNLSKGAAYYYFDDKADLFLTMVKYYQERAIRETDLDLNALTAATFWPTLIETYHRQLARLPEEPWLLTAWKLISRLSKEARSNPILNKTYNQAVESLIAFVKRGQEVGAVRTDLPDELIVALVRGLDIGFDEWVMEHLEEIGTKEFQNIVLATADGLRRLLTPPEQPLGS